MKYGPCPKCQSTEIAIINSGSLSGNAYNMIMVGFRTIYLTRYICVTCGFTENYVNKTEDLETLRKKAIEDEKKGEKLNDGFV